MGTIHDKRKRNSELDALLNGDVSNAIVSSSPAKVDEQVAATQVVKEEDHTEISKQNQREIQSYSSQALQALSMVDDIVTKNYVMRLSDMDIVPVDQNEIGRNTIVFKVNKMVYEKDEYATEKFINALGAMSYADCSVFLILDGHKDRTDFYIGIRNNDERRTDSSVAETFENSLKGQFPGIGLKQCSVPEHVGSLSAQQQLFKRFNQASSVCSCSGVPSYKDEDGKYTNQTFVQGIEKLALAMQGKEYTAIILASNISGENLASVRQGYERLYTQMSAVATQQVAYSTTESLANAISRTHGTSNSKSHAVSDGTSDTKGTTITRNTNHSVSKKSGLAQAGCILGGALAAIGGVALMATGIGAPVGLTLVGGGAALAAAGANASQKTTGISKATAEQKSHTNIHNVTDTDTTTEQFSETNGRTASVGSSKNFTLTVHNKHVEEILKRIDNQLERLAMAEGTGVWASGSYFLSYENDRDTAETAAAIFKSIMQGEKSGVEASAVNRWLDTKTPERLKLLTTSITSFVHPTFIYENSKIDQHISVNASSLISTAELAMQMGLPRKSVPGFPVLEHISLGKEVVTQSGREIDRALKMGYIFDQGKVRENNPVNVEAKSLTQHVFVTGSTGCGKSETVYRLISQAKKKGAKFLIVEPAKGEYKNVFGNANVYGSNPELSQLLHINPFKFPKGIHVLEHIDRLTEIFNVCWPMYAAMPAVLKKAIIRSYEKAGWNLVKNKNKYGRIFPTFKDLLYELEDVIKDSAYSEEVKGNYVGSLVTRVESLTNGLNGAIFGGEEIPDSVLFDEDTIIDLSRIGSQETKALIMGLIVMRLNEYRMVNATEANVGLKHLTVLEEAHNILKRTSTEQSQEGSNLAGKAVEMITNSIAEMRTYGEGFVIVDQSPTSVDPAAIKNTNTKFIMRLPDGDDRRIAGKSAGLKDSQLDEIAKLPTGVAVTYQNDWEEPVLCKITMRDKSDEVKYSFEPTEDEEIQSECLSEVIKFLVHGRVSGKVDFDKAKVLEAKSSSLLTTAQKIQLSEFIDEYTRTESLGIWSKERFEELANLLTDLLGIRGSIERIAGESKSLEDLDSKLEAKVVEAIGEVPNPVNIFVRQALLKAYSLGGETRELIYKRWYRGLESKLIQY